MIVAKVKCTIGANNNNKKYVVLTVVSLRRFPLSIEDVMKLNKMLTKVCPIFYFNVVDLQNGCSQADT